jgi:hypothetical protein
MHSSHGRGHVRAGLGTVEKALKVFPQVDLVPCRGLFVDAFHDCEEASASTKSGRLDGIQTVTDRAVINDRPDPHKEAKNCP